jgi:hypothetical protein
VARLFTGMDTDLKQVAATVACAPGMMNALDRLLREGAKQVEGVTYLGREIGSGDTEWDW